MAYNVQGARPVFLVDDAGNTYQPGGANGGALDASFQQVTATGTLGALNATQAITIGRRSTLTVHTTGTWVGNISLQGSLDGGTNWVTLNAASTWIVLSTGAFVAAIGANGIFQASVTGLTSLRVIMSAYTSGTANVYLVASDEPAGVAIDTPLPTGGNLLGNINIAGAAGFAVTKASGVASATTDVSLVVQTSPNVYAQGILGGNGALGTAPTAFLKASAGSVLSLAVSNTSASPIFVKLYNQTTAPTIGAGTPIITIPVAANSTVSTEFGPLGMRFSTGIAYTVTGAIGDTDTTAVTAGSKLAVTYV